ncbi:MAG: hypothetical protein K2P75_04900 [Sphingobacteriaceae bacterium]|nr:hypothetical protein [Sphingobacteriaceae bacterium]
MHSKTSIKNNKLVGVIGGTHFDSKLGMEFLSQRNITAISSNISDDPFTQTMLQLSSKTLTDKVKNKINILLNGGCASIFIYCNSLSGAIDLDYLRDYFSIPLFTPIETYPLVSNQYNSIGVTAANCQSLSNIERIILKTNPRAVITGFSSLLIVDSIEKGLSPKEIINQYDLIMLCNLLEKNNVRLLLLGCTHFSYFYNELSASLREEKIGITLFDPSETMLKNILAYQQQALI